MEKFKINSCEFEFDVMELDNAKKIEDEADKIEEIRKKASNVVLLSEVIELICNAVFDFFDSLLGIGIHKKIFGNRINMTQALNAYISFMEYVGNQKNTITVMAENVQNNIKKKSKK